MVDAQVLGDDSDAATVTFFSEVFVVYLETDLGSILQTDLGDGLEVN